MDMIKKSFLMMVALLASFLASNAQTDTYVSTRTEKGFFAPHSTSAGLSYIHESYRAEKNNVEDPITLKGVGFDMACSWDFYKNLSIVFPLGFYYTWMKDSYASGYNALNKVSRNEIGLQLGLMAGTGYRINRNTNVTFSFGPKINCTLGDWETTRGDNYKYTIEYTYGDWTRKSNGTKTRGKSEATHKLIDIPLCFNASIRHKGYGLYVSYDYGLINRLNKDYYDYTRKNDYLRVGVMVYFDEFTLGKKKEIDSNSRM